MYLYYNPSRYLRWYNIYFLGFKTAFTCQINDIKTPATTAINYC